MQKFTELKELISEAEKEAQSFYGKGVKAASTRLRNAMTAIKNKAQEVREDVLEKRVTN